MPYTSLFARDLGAPVSAAIICLYVGAPFVIAIPACVIAMGGNACFVDWLSQPKVAPRFKPRAYSVYAERKKAPPEEVKFEIYSCSNGSPQKAGEIGLKEKKVPHLTLINGRKEGPVIPYHHRKAGANLLRASGKKGPPI